MLLTTIDHSALSNAIDCKQSRVVYCELSVDFNDGSRWVNRPATTIKQIADAIGVHPSTVSRALDPKKRHLVAADVAKRITAQAQALGYQLNRLAANLRLGRSSLNSCAKGGSGRVGEYWLVADALRIGSR